MKIYPHNALQKLDFPFVLKELENLCSGTLGKNLLLRQPFINDPAELNKELNYVKELKRNYTK
ncbi:MAG: hypothetical protein JWN78_2747 [Bacteroidota bacterium]|nr:hypothetical protein [Bacteroidota bacterium]